MIDYVIIGGGPSGITLAHLFGSRKDHSVVLLDMNDNIGGCHRVTRVNGLFTEHGPRIYMSSFINTKTILKQMNLSFDDLFTPYDFGLASGINVFKTFSMKEYFILAYTFIKLSLNSDYGRTLSVYDFAKYHNFSEKSLSQMDKLCRLTDGADAKRYSIHEFLNLLNQNTFYKSYQPKEPNDIGLFPKIQIPSSRVSIHTNTFVNRLNIENNKIISVETNKGTLQAKNFILAIPPKNIYELLQRSNLLKLTNFTKEFVIDSLYDQYIPITYHWDKVIDIPKIWGFPESDWGVIVIVLTDYMKFKDKRSKTVMSVCVSLTNIKSKKTKKTCNETSSKEELINEVFRQVKEKYGDLPKYNYGVLHPKVERINGKWIETDTAYMATPKSKFIPFETKIENLYNVGTQNGKSDYVFTSMESAITNAIILFNLLTNSHIPVTRGWYLTDIIHIFYLFIIALVVHRCVRGRWLPLK